MLRHDDADVRAGAAKALRRMDRRALDPFCLALMEHAEMTERAWSLRTRSA